MTAAAAEEIIAALGRKVLPVKGDGNCLFCALGYCLYRTEMMHSRTRMELTNFEPNNLTIWGTQVELHATASL